MISRRMLRLMNAVVIALLFLFPLTALAEEDDPRVPVRIGWQMPAVSQAGIVQVLKRTDVLAQHGLDPSLVPFSFGTPQIESAFEGDLDIFFAGDQPAIHLLARGGKWKIVARCFLDRLAVVVPLDSPLRDMRDLEGKTVATPFGSIAHRVAFLAQQEAGLDPDVDVLNVDMDVFEIIHRVNDGGVESWEGIDAAAFWEPNVSDFQLAGITRHLAESKGLGVVAISDKFIAKHPEAAVQFLVALTRAWEFFVLHPEQVMDWYGDDTQLGYSQKALLAAVRIDPNFQAKSVQDIDLELNDQMMADLERHAAWGDDAWEDGTRIRKFIDHDLLDRAKAEIAQADFEDLQVILPSIRDVDPTGSGVGYGLDAIPLWLVFGFMVLIVLLAIELGLWLGRRAKHTISPASARPIGTVAAAVLAMMAFVIALTFGSATARFDDRKAALVEDVTAIHTAYLQANLLPEPHRTTVRSLLRDYVQARAGIVYAYGQPATLRTVEKRARTLQALMWSHVEEMNEENGGSGAHGAFASALNQVFNLHAKRVALGAYYRIPGFLWWAIIFASAVAMVAVGFQFGIGDGRRIMTANLALALTFGLVIMLAFDLDRAGEGLVAVNQKPVIDLYKALGAE